MKPYLKMLGILGVALPFLLTTQLMAEDKIAGVNPAQEKTMACDRSLSIVKKCTAYPGVPMTQEKFIKGGCTNPGVWSTAGCSLVGAVGKCLKKGKYMNKEIFIYDASQALTEEEDCIVRGNRWTALPEQSNQQDHAAAQAPAEPAQ